MKDRLRKYVNREISWLSFNGRVLQEAADRSVPLLERLKFLGIFSSNLDEFFRVRVGTLRRMIDANVKGVLLFGRSPKRIFGEVHDIVVDQRQRFDELFAQIHQELERENIFILNETQLDSEQEAFVNAYFENEVRSTLVPIMLNGADRFPYLKNQVIYLAIHLEPACEGARYALIEVPTEFLPRFVVLPTRGKGHHVIMLDDVIRHGLIDIFSIFGCESVSAFTIKLTRDAEIDIDDDVRSSLFEKVAKSIKQRDLGQPVRFVYDRKMPLELLDYLLQSAKLTEVENVIDGGRYHNARDFIRFPKVGRSTLCYPDLPPVRHPAIDRRTSLFSIVDRQDILFHYPYHSFNGVIDLLREAAIDPRVKSIKTTIYRAAKDSKVINALRNAVRNGKSVTVMLELQARFDEEANIRWTRKLEEEGARVITSISGLKVHAKLSLITRREGKGVAHYAVIGTGNFNEHTAKQYTDHALVTANKKITREVRNVFEFLENTYKNQTYKHLIVSPADMRKRWHKLIKTETRNAKAGKEAYIYAKLNNLVDKRIIDRLYEASAAGVKIKMIVRGICSLVPGVEKLSENIEVISIIDRYLEHSRLFVFCAGGNEQIFISSADWMVRNLDNRVEVAVPIYDPAIREELKTYLEMQFRDSQRARIISKAGDNLYAARNGQYRAQTDIYAYLKDKAKQPR